MEVTFFFYFLFYKIEKEKTVLETGYKTSSRTFEITFELGSVF